MEPPRLPSLVVALRPAGQGPCHLWRCHDILDGSSAGSWKLGGSSTTQTPHSPQRMLLAPQRRRSLARSLTGVETPTAGPPGHLPSRAPGAARAATCPLQGSLTTHVPKSPSPPFFITTTTTTRPSTDDPQIFPPPDRGLFLSVLISPTTALSEHRFIYHRLPYPSATYLSIPAPTIAPHRDPHAPKHIHIYSEAKRNLPRFCFLTVLSTTASVSNPRSAQAASTHTSHNDGTLTGLPSFPMQQAQTLEQRRRNAKFAKVQEAKMGKSEEQVKKRTKEAPKAPISMFWIVILGFIVFGGLVFEALSRMFGQ
ncbi:hypothetical protein Purlil1_8828 [Purpureocillium lilacinum]|nr:hypothetical protein Purlil1_8828 [Purpureocillium lilacinum]